MIRRTLPLVLSLFALAGCGSVTTYAVPMSAPRPASAAPVRVVMEGQTPAPGYTEIGLVQACGTGNKANMPSIVQGLIAKAQSLGADALINVRIDQGATQANGTAVAVRYAP